MANSGTFKKGDNRPRKPKGATNHMTRTAKEAFQLAFDQLGGAQGLVEWAMDPKQPANRSAFYTLYARLIPTEVKGDPSAPLTLTITREVITKAK